jgi:hypothetical protein
MDMTVDSGTGICSELTPPAFTIDGLVRFLPRDTSTADVRALLTASGDDNKEFSSRRDQFPSIHDGRLRPRKSN